MGRSRSDAADSSATARHGQFEMRGPSRANVFRHVAQEPLSLDELGDVDWLARSPTVQSQGAGGSRRSLRLSSRGEQAVSGVNGDSKSMSPPAPGAVEVQCIGLAACTTGVGRIGSASGFFSDGSGCFRKLAAPPPPPGQHAWEVCGQICSTSGRTASPPACGAWQAVSKTVCLAAGS